MFSSPIWLVFLLYLILNKKSIHILFFSEKFNHITKIQNIWMKQIMNVNMKYLQLLKKHMV